MLSKNAQVWLFSILSASALALAWLLPATFAALVLGWLAVLSLTLAVRVEQRAPYLPIYAGGLVAIALGFHWLFDTISLFGGFSKPATAAIYILFVLGSAVQYIAFTFLYRNLPQVVDHLGMRTAIAWTTVELLPLRIFPWQMAHTQLRFLPFIQIADLAGTLLITFIMFWLCESVWRRIAAREANPLLSGAMLVFVLALVYGTAKIFVITATEHATQKVAVVQANITTAEKHNVQYFTKNTERYINLTRQIAEDGLLVVWPETVIQEWVSTRVGHVHSDPRLPVWSKAMHLLTGALTYDEITRNIFNSAIAVESDGDIPLPYHKQILMPFGEYIPFVESFPWLEQIVITAGDFTAGRDVSVFDFTRCPDPASEIEPENCPVTRAAPLICYEDVIPDLARQATLAGAQLLVNLTNDAWFGDTAAPYQHHIIASFRAIENRRTLLRSTNSGLTAIVDPLGRTTSYLKPFSEGVILTEVALLSGFTLYTRYFGDLLWWGLAIICACTIFYQKVINKGGPQNFHTRS